MANISLTKMEQGKKGIVKSINGGHGLISKLAAMGVRPGVRIKKISGLLMRGPVIIEVGTARVALGYGMARRIVVVND